MIHRFRNSDFIDFNTGTVKIAPIQLQFKMSMAGKDSFTDLVRLFECRVEVWQLGVAVQMLREIEFGHPPAIWSHSAYGLLMLTVAYFETVGKLLNTEKQDQTETSREDIAFPSANDFNTGFRDVYHDLRTKNGSTYDPKEFYYRMHAGLIPLGSTQRGIWLHNERSISTKDFDVVPIGAPTRLKYYINPHAIVPTIVNHFPTVIERLNHPSDEFSPLRARFMKFFADS